MTEGTAAALRQLSDAGQPDLAGRLDRLFSAFAVQAVASSTFADALSDALDGTAVAASTKPSQRTYSRTRDPRGSGTRNIRGRRPPGPFNPYEAYADGEEILRRRLGDCDVDQLKDMVAEHGMDQDRLALKWKTPDRLIERIVETVSARAHKGDAFRGPVPTPRAHGAETPPAAEEHDGPPPAAEQ